MQGTDEHAKPMTIFRWVVGFQSNISAVACILYKFQF